MAKPQPIRNIREELEEAAGAARKQKIPSSPVFAQQQQQSRLSDEDERIKGQQQMLRSDL